MWVPPAMMCELLERFAISMAVTSSQSHIGIHHENSHIYYWALFLLHLAISHPILSAQFNLKMHYCPVPSGLQSEFSGSLLRQH